jgi:hypothetical protein
MTAARTGGDEEELHAQLLRSHLEDDGDGGTNGEADAAARRGRGRGYPLSVGCGCLRWLRWARHELLGFGGLLLAGLVMGLSLPKNPRLTDPVVATVSNVMGWTYFLAWTISFYPQVRTCLLSAWGLLHGPY